MYKRKIFGLVLIVLLFVAYGIVSAQFPVTVTDQTPAVPLTNPTPSSYQPRYISGFGSDNTFTVFFEDRDAGYTISYAQTTTGPTGFPASITPTNITDTHFCIKDWPITIGMTTYNYRAWASVGNNPQHHFYVSNDLTNWTLVSTFTIPNAASFTDAHGWVYYGFHDVILINGTYYAFAESNQSQTMLVRSANGDDVWEAFASIGGRPGWGPLELPSGVSLGWTPSGAFVDLGYNRGYGKIYADPRDNNFYLAINEAAKSSLTPADLEAAFINPANWTWHNGTTGPASAPILSATSEHDLRECWIVPNSDPDADWVIVYDADYGSADGGKALGYATLTPPPPPPVHNITQGTDYNTIMAAVNAANPGDIIEVDPGTYPEKVFIRQSITLRGAQAGVDARGRTGVNESIISPTDAYVIVVQADNVTIDGFTIKNPGLNTNADAAGIYVSDVIGQPGEGGTQLENIIVKNNIIENIGDDNRPMANGTCGVVVGPKTDNVEVAYNEIRNLRLNNGDKYGWAPAGVMIWGDVAKEAKNTNVHHNLIHTINNSVSVTTPKGIMASMYAENTIIDNNEIYDVARGFNSSSTALGTHVITNNHIHDCVYGLRIFTSNTTITGNTLNGNQWGLYASSWTGNPIHVDMNNNNIYGNSTYGVEAVAYSGNSCTVNGILNWWGDASGPAGAGPGSGDGVSDNVLFCPWLDGPYPGGSPTGPGGALVTNIDTGEMFCSIQSAIDDAETLNGHTLVATAATYPERVTITKSLTICGAQQGVDPNQASARTDPSAESIIDITGLSVTNPNVAVEIPSTVTNVILEGFTIKGSPTSHYADEAVIRIWDNDITVQDNIIDGFYGVLFKGADNLTVQRNRMVVNKLGVTVQPYAANNVTIVDNRFFPGNNPASDASGIYMTATSNSNITGNFAAGFVGGRGAAGSNLDHLTVTGNDFYANKDAISFWGNTTFITITENNLSDNSRYGINIKGQDIEITKNEIANNGDMGINIDKHTLTTERVTVNCNNILHNANYGLYVNTINVTETVDADNNWWGHASGPTHASNPGGTGDDVSDNVDFDPWLSTYWEQDNGCNPPTAITLSAFSALVENDVVKISWTTETEINNLGFNIHRSQQENGVYSKINESIIVGEGDAFAGANYTYSDRPDEAGTHYYKLEDVSVDGQSTFHGPVVVSGVTLVQTAQPVIPTDYQLSQNYPNPFNPETHIQYAIPKDGFVAITIYDVRGQIVRTIVNERKSAGTYAVSWDSRNENGAKVTSGVYFYRIDAGEFNMTKKMVLMK